ncbi:MAG TPA: disulfide bond formation protein B [Rhodanobacteraceae bacterium]
MNPLRWNYRSAYIAGFVICAALIGYALFSEIHLGLTPCPLCVFQRIAFIVMGVFFLIGGLHAPSSRWRWLYTGLIIAGAIWGIAVAGRQLWLQSLPPDLVPSCGPGLGYLFDTFSWLKALKIVFAGSGECAAVHWRFLGLTMAGWTTIWYVLLGAWALWAARKRRNPLFI